MVEDIQCPVCGYYCLGNGGMGCIDKPSVVRSGITLPLLYTERKSWVKNLFLWGKEIIIKRFPFTKV